MKKKFFVLLLFMLVGIAVFADIFISEMCDPYYDYRSDRFIEIYNSGSEAVDLTGWTVVAVGNGEDIFTWNLSGTIAAGDALVCGDATTVDDFTVDFPDEAWSDSDTSWNGKVGDGAKLFDNNGTLLDNAVVDATAFENKTYVRNPDISSPNTAYNENEWTATSVDHSSDATPGTHICGGEPIISLAYSTDFDLIDVIYNIALETINAEDFVLTGSETTTFGNAEIDEEDARIVHLSSPSNPINADLTIDTISDDANRTSFDFYAGIMPISYLNTLNPAGVLEDDKYATFRGMLTANDEYNNVWISDNTGPYNGILVYDYDFDDLVGTDLGTEVTFAATRYVYNNLSELKNPKLISLAYVDCIHPPTVISGSDIDMNLPADTNPGEKWEGQLVEIFGVVVTAPARDDLYFGSDDGGETMFAIGDNVDYQYSEIAAVLDAAVESGEPIHIVGVVDYYNEHYRINPRFIDDLPVFENTLVEQPSVTMDCYPNPFRNATTISFNFSSQKVQNAEIEIYNLKGQKIRKFSVDDSHSKVIWDGKDGFGKDVKSGIYFYKLKADNFISTKKIIMMK